MTLPEAITKLIRVDIAGAKDLTVDETQALAIIGIAARRGQLMPDDPRIEENPMLVDFVEMIRSTVALP